MTLSAGKTYDIFTPSGYFKLNGLHKSNGIHTITTDTVVHLYDEDALYITKFGVISLDNFNKLK
jgi:hypothetical protein